MLLLNIITVAFIYHVINMCQCHINSTLEIDCISLPRVASSFGASSHLCTTAYKQLSKDTNFKSSTILGCSKYLNMVLYNHMVAAMLTDSLNRSASSCLDRPKLQLVHPFNGLPPPRCPQPTQPAKLKLPASVTVSLQTACNPKTKSHACFHGFLTVSLAAY